MFQGMEYVYEVYKEKSFSKAARKMFISQPSLSANVKRVEQKLGYPIFDRSTKPLELTEFGKNYIRSIEQILSVKNEFANYVNDLGDLKTGNLILGGSSLFSSWILPPLMGEFARRYPLVKMVLVEETTAQLEQLLQNGSIDIMLDNCLLDEEVFENTVFRREHLLLAVPGNFKVNQCLTDYQISMKDIRDGNYLREEFPSVALERFCEEPFIMMKPDNDTGKRAMDMFRKCGFAPRILFELDQQMTSYNITCSGMGISFISDTLITKVPTHPDVIYYKLPSELSERKLFFYWKRGRYVSRPMEEFLRIAAG